MTVNAGLRYTLNFPSTEKDNQAAVFNLRRSSSSTSARTVSRAPRVSCTSSTSVRVSASSDRLTDKTVVQHRLRPGLDRDGRHHHAVHDAGLSVPADRLAADARQHRPGVHAGRRPDGRADSADADAGLGQGVFAVDRDLGSGYVQQWNASLQRELTTNIVVEVAYVGSKITHVGIPDTNSNQLTVEQLALGTPLLQRVPNPFFGIIPRSSSLGDPTISRAQLLKPYPEYTTVSLYRNNVGTTIYHGVYAKLEQRFSRRPLVSASATRDRS